MAEKFEQVKKIEFNQKPILISANYRPIYKITQILLVLYYCSHNKSASLLKIHFFSWIMNSKIRMNDILEKLKSESNIGVYFWRMEPSLNRAIGFGIGEKLIENTGGKYMLTEKGEEFLEAIIEEKTLMRSEREFCLNIRKKISETFIIELAKKWGGI